MSHHRNLRVCYSAHQLFSFPAAFELHCFGASFLYKPNCIRDTFAFVRLVAAERHIGYKKSASHRASNTACIQQHLFHRYGQRILVTLHHHRE